MRRYPYGARPMFPQDHISNKKDLAIRKDRTRLQSKFRSMGHMESPSIDKPQPEIVSITISITLASNDCVLIYALKAINIQQFTSIITCNTSMYNISHFCCIIVHRYKSFYIRFFFQQGLCRRKLDVTVRRMKDMPRIMALSLYLPNCDKKGFFKRKQVRSTVFIFLKILKISQVTVFRF